MCQCVCASRQGVPVEREVKTRTRSREGVRQVRGHRGEEQTKEVQFQQEVKTSSGPQSDLQNLQPLRPEYVSRGGVS